MAEATDRPPDPNAMTAAPDDGPQSYGSLSLLALGGLAVAVVYSLVVVVWGVVALSNRTPWILPLWSLAVPLAAVVLSWAAKVRIQNSEGTLTGTRLTAWGTWLSIVVGLMYTAYYSACYLSIVMRMAAPVADEFLDDVKNDRLDRAFLLSRPPPRPVADDHLRARLELDFDRGERGSGALTEFRHSPFVRLIEQGGDAVRMERLGVKDWGAAAGGYQAQFDYRISTPYATADVLLTVIGVENADDSGGRQWYVRNPEMTAPVYTDEGRRMAEQAATAQAFAQAWLAKAGNWDWTGAYLDTLPPAERQSESKANDTKLKADASAFRTGALVHADPKTFWAGANDRENIIARAKGLFGPGGDSPKGISLESAMPTYRREGDRMQFGFDVGVALPPEYTVQARLMVAADARNGDPNPDDWWVESLDLISGKSMAESGPPKPKTPQAPKP